MKKRRSGAPAEAHARDSAGGARRGFSRDRLSIALALGLAALTLGVFARATALGFVNYDDTVYVTENAVVQQGLTWDSVSWAFTHPLEGNWHPLTVLSHMVDVEIFGVRPAGHHLTSVLLHAANVLLLFALLLRLTGRRVAAAVASALFAVHPLNVQSVAWVAERKNVLSTLFWLLALLAFLGYARAPGWRRYALVFGLFILGLASKPMVVTLPVTLLLIDVWSGRAAPGPPGAPWSRRWWWVLEKIPMFVASALCGVATFLAQEAAGTMPVRETLPILYRIGNAVVAYGWYVAKTVWPSGLSVFYPHPLTSLEGPEVALSAAALVALSLAAWKAGREARLGWSWYALTLLPVIGLIQVGEQAHADRYAYVPIIGLFIMVVWGTLAVTEARPSWMRRCAAGSALAAIAVFAGVTIHDLGYWKDSISLFRHALAVDSRNHVAQGNLGLALIERGEIDEALTHFRAAVLAKPDSGPDHLNLGNALAMTGHVEEAREQYETATQLSPDDPRPRYDLGKVLLAQGRPDEAAKELREAIRLAPGHVGARIALGTALMRLRQTDEAIEVLARAADDDPANPDVLLALGEALAAGRRDAEALGALREALSRAPTGWIEKNRAEHLIRRLESGRAEVGPLPRPAGQADPPTP